MELSEIDCQILLYVYENKQVPIAAVLEKFPSKEINTRYRLRTFEDRHFISRVRDEQRKITDEVKMSGDGINAIQDYLYEKEQQKKNFRWEIFKLSVSALFGYLAKSLVDYFLG